MAGMMSSAKIEKKIEKLEVLMTKVLQGSKPAREYWKCLMCQDDKCFISRKTCHACGAERGAQPPKSQAAKVTSDESVAAAAVVTAPMLVDFGRKEADVPPEQEVKELENLLKVLKSSGPSAKKDLLVASLQEQLQTAKGKVLQARPLPVRLQAAVRHQEAAAAAVQVAGEAAEQAKLVLMAKQQVLAEAQHRLTEAEKEVAEVQALLGRPQLEAGAAAAVTVCLAMLKQSGMAAEQLRAFDLALRAAFVGTPEAQQVSRTPVSPFAPAVKQEEGGKMDQAMSSPFVEGGTFGSQGLSPFVAQAYGHEQAPAEELERNRTEALDSLKLRLEAQKGKCAAAANRVVQLREAAKKAEETTPGSGGDLEQQAGAAEQEAAAEQTLCAALEGQKAELEREKEAFGRSLASKDPRTGPY